jgi:hypothetical protein
MNKKILLVFCLAVSLIFVSGCTQKISEKAAEKVIEKASNGEVNVDINKNEVKIDTKEGSGQVGGDISVPADFPLDVFVIDGTVKTSFKNIDKNGWSLSVETNKPVTEVKSLYEQKLKDSGWTLNAIMDIGGSITFSGTKDKRSVSVMINSVPDSGKTNVLIGTSKN